MCDQIYLCFSKDDDVGCPYYWRVETKEFIPSPYTTPNLPLDQSCS